jgi:hypothetical protein
MVMRKRVEAMLERMRPVMQADGGDIELVEVDGNSAGVRLTGTCLRRPSTHMAIYSAPNPRSGARSRSSKCYVCCEASNMTAPGTLVMERSST